jgi:hypothetical protein
MFDDRCLVCDAPAEDPRHMFVMQSRANAPDGIQRTVGS